MAVKPCKDLITSWHPLTLEDLEKHADVDGNDAWICIQGLVYDVSQYAALHPGGIEKIRKYAGKDATEAFSTVHPYVHYDAILEGCQIGIIKGHPDAPKRNPLTDCPCFGGPFKAPTTYFKQDSIVGTFVLDFLASSHENDWTAGVVDKKFLHVMKCMDRKQAWLSKYELPEPLINDEIDLMFGDEFKHAEITLRKTIPSTIWANQMHGLKEAGHFVPLNKWHSKFDAFIFYKKCLTQNVIMFGIQVVNSARVRVPLGYHVTIHIGDVFRPYTPVCLQLIENERNANLTHVHHSHIKPENMPTILYFMIKIYAKGQLTKALDELPLDEGLEIPTLQISTPFGFFNKDFVKEFNTLFLIAAGSGNLDKGITPMIRILERFWEVKDRLHGKRIALVFFCEKIYDLIWRKEFEQMTTVITWFEYFPVLSRPSTYCKWEGLKGRITPELVHSVIDQMHLSNKDKAHTKACVCGPAGFNSAAVKSLKDVVELESTFVFTN